VFATPPSISVPASVGAVAGIAVTSSAAQLPDCTGSQPYPLGQTSQSLLEDVDSGGAALTLNGTELFVACNAQVAAVAASPPAGTQYTVTYTAPGSSTKAITAEVHSQTSEVANLLSIGGQDPAAFVAAHHAADVIGQTLSLTWSLPTTFDVNMLYLDCNALDFLGNQFLLAPTFLAPNATSGTTAAIPATLPSTGLATAGVSCFVNFVGVSGELLNANFEIL
jgi:hypothetical protein